ncbi:hypothetical protein PV325_000673 [Microctonus aethiopoides]|nr:hypothetical protein PV325_000673 [Microctonus aethiopoides]
MTSNSCNFDLPTENGEESKQIFTNGDSGDLARMQELEFWTEKSPVGLSMFMEDDDMDCTVAVSIIMNI